MNIFEFLSFDIGEFVTSVPGILIISGIVLLILALIILSTGKKKAPVVEAVAIEPTQPAVDTASQQSQAEQPVNQPVAFDNNVEKSLADMSYVASVPAPEPAMEIPEVKEAAPEVKPVVEEPVQTPATPEITINPSFSLPKVESLEVEAAPVIQPTPIVEEAPRPIYGGANPLENTAPLPVEATRQAYSGSLESHPIPTIQPVVPETPVMNTEPSSPVPSAPIVTEPVHQEVKPSSAEIETLEF